jgi:hypothetical protein
MYYASLLPSFQLKRLDRILTVKIYSIQLILHRDRSSRDYSVRNRRGPEAGNHREVRNPGAIRDEMGCTPEICDERRRLMGVYRFDGFMVH